MKTGKDSRLEIRCSESELKLWTEAAEKSGFKVAAWVREILTDKAITSTEPLPQPRYGILCGKVEDQDLGRQLKEAAEKRTPPPEKVFEPPAKQDYTYTGEKIFRLGRTMYEIKTEGGRLDWTPVVPTKKSK
jgi:hypothetical protein